MKLNNYSKNEFRNKVVDKLKVVPEGNKVEIKKEILDELLFDTIVLDKEKNIVVKLPVWSGEFLRKIDLSNVNFTNVSWTILDQYLNNDFKINFSDININEKNALENIIKARINYIKEHFSISSIIDYSETNANIDLTKSFECLHGNYIQIRQCNFKGLDFSKQDLSSVRSFEFINSSMEDAKISIPEKANLKGKNSSLKGIDLSSRTIYAHEYLTGNTESLTNCDLTNTKINITLLISKLRDLEVELRNAMEIKWIGCFTNGKKVLTYEEKILVASILKSQYEDLKKSTYDSVLDSIDTQIVFMKK